MKNIAPISRPKPVMKPEMVRKMARAARKKMLASVNSA